MPEPSSAEKAREKTLTGAAGEYYVAFRLAALGYAVGVTTAWAIDVVAASAKTAKAITIQTKTASSAFKVDKDGDSYWQWPLGKEDQPESKSFYYAFIDLKGDASKNPKMFIVLSTKLKTLG